MASITNLSGNIVNFSTSLEKPLQNLKIHFNPIQEGSGDPSPDNVRPITGWTGINLYHSGKNLFNLTAESFIIPDSSAYAYAPIPVNFEAEFSFIKKNTNIDTSNISFGVSYYAPTSVSEINKGYTWNIERGVIQTGNKSKNVVTYPSNTDIYLQVAHYAVIYPKTAIADFFSAYDVQLEIASVTSYEPYQGNIIPVDWSDNGTIYGGYIDFANNELIQEWASLEIQWNKYKNNYAMTETNRRSYLFPINRKEIGGQNQMMCNIAIPGHHLRDNVHFYIAPENNYVYMFLPKDIDENTIVQVVAKITEPIHHSLTTQQINTLKGINNIWSDVNGQIDASYSDRSGSMLEYRKNIIINSPHIESVSDNIASFNTDMVSPLKSCKINFSPIQEGSGDPSPDNVRPISGHNSINIIKTGKNLAEFSDSKGPFTNYYNGGNGWLAGEYWKIPDQTKTYTYSLYLDNRNATSESNAAIWFKNKDNDAYAGIAAGTRIEAGEEGWSTITFGNNLTRFYAGLGISLKAGCIATKGMLELGDTCTEYEPYNGSTTSITLPETMYGGYINLLTGEVWKTWAKETFDGTESGWGLYGASRQITFYRRIEEKKTGIGTSISSIFPNVKNSYFWDTEQTGVYGDHSSIPNIYVNAPYKMPNRVPEWCEWLSNNPMELCYELATPVLVTTLTPTQIKTLRGTNNIWTNSNGATEIKYWTH